MSARTAALFVGSDAGLSLFLVFGMDVHTLHHHAAIINLNADDFTTFTFVFETPADNFNGITFTNLHIHGFAPPGLKNFRGK
jgi:hypothetical protein